MNQRLLCLSILVGIVATGCDIKSNRRDESVLEFAPVGAVVDRFWPPTAALVADGSPRACESEGCPTLAEAIGPHFAKIGLVTIPGLLVHIDARIADYKTRIVDHYVPCLDSSEASLTSELTPQLSVTSPVNCFGEFEGTSGSRVVAGFEQFLFSGGKGWKSSTAIVRMGVSEEAVTTLWVSVGDDGTANFWMGANLPLTSQGRTLTRMKIASSGTLEMATAGLEQYTGANQLTCGAHLRMSESKMFVSGRFRPPAASSRSNADPCESTGVATFCLNVPGLTAANAADCTGDGLDTMTLPSLQPDDIKSDEWGSKVYVNYSSTVPRFTMEGLEKI